MIYIISGNDNRKKNSYFKKIHGDESPIILNDTNTTKEVLFDYAKSVSLFGQSPIVVIENKLKNEDLDFSTKELSVLKESNTKFIFIEEKLLTGVIKKYEKFATIEEFSTDILKQTPKMNIFNIADNFSSRDKINTWVIFREAVSRGIAPEEISGIIFWKIKTMLLSGTKFFSVDELKNRSSELVSIYHKAHRGEIDFVIGLEQFILSSLNKIKDLK